MGIMKTIAIELEELDAEVDFDNADDLFDLVIDTQISNHKLSKVILQYIVHSINEYPHLQWLRVNDEFRGAFDWHWVEVAA
jgi:hypothetical protein